MPLGQARNEAAEREVRVIETEGPDEVRAYALESLVEALSWTGQAEKSVAAFVRLLRWWDAHPEHFDEADQDIMFWEFGWIVSDLARLVTVPRSRVEATFADMERRFAEADRGMERVWAHKLDWALLRGGDDVDDIFRSWLTQPIDEADSCDACHGERHADYLLWKGLRGEAIAILEQGVESGVSCTREPASMMCELVIAYLNEGRADEAERMLPKAQAELKRATSLNLAVSHALVVEALARGHQLGPAFAVATEQLSDDSRWTTYTKLVVARHLIAALSALERAGLGESIVPFPQAEERTVSRYLRHLLDEYEPLSLAFDHRHGNDEQAQRLTRALATEPTERPFTLPGDARERQSVSRTPAAVFTVSGGSNPTLSPVDSVKVLEPPASAEVLAAADVARHENTARSALDDMRIAADEAFQDGDHTTAARLYRHAAAVAQADSRLRDSGWCWAEAARNAQELGESSVAAHDYREALTRLRAAGVTLEEIAPVFTAWAPHVGPSDYALFIESATTPYPSPADPAFGERREAIITAMLGPSMVGTPVLRRYLLAWSDLNDAVARVLATHGGAEQMTEAMTLAETCAERYEILGRTDDAAHSWWLAAALSDQIDRAEKETRTDFDKALTGFRSSGRRNIMLQAQVARAYARYLIERGHNDEAIGVLKDLAGESGRFFVTRSKPPEASSFPILEP